MSAQTIRQRNAIRSRRTQQRATAGEWAATPTIVPSPRPSLTDRIATASWRLHDGMPWAWAIAGAVVLLASALATVAIVATALGWQP